MREITGKQVLGGLHDYINSMKRNDCLQYISTNVLNYKELLNQKKFYGVVEPNDEYTMIKFGGDGHDEIAYQYLQIKDALKEESIGHLKDYCLRLEDYVNQKTGRHVMGGLHDYINSMNRDACEEYISRAVLNNKELLKMAKFTSVVSPKVIIGGDDHDEVAFKFLQLKKKLQSQSDDDLRKTALKLEKYINHGKQVFGGLHDYIRNMSRQEILDYCSQVTLNNQELLEESKFESVVGEIKLLEDDTPVIGGLHDYIYRLDRNTLRRYALTCEQYKIEQTKRKIRGGIHDYINRLTNDQIAEYILEATEAYPALDNQARLDELSATYGIQN